MIRQKKKQSLKPEDIFAPRSPLQFLGFALVGVIINLLSGGNPLGIIGVVTLFIYWLWIDRQRTKRLFKQLGDNSTW